MSTTPTATRGALWRAALVLVAVAIASCLAACDESEESVGAAGPLGSTTPMGSVAPTPGGIVLPPQIPPVTNPLELPVPTDHLVPEEGQRIFAVPREMLVGARVGTAMKLAAAWAIGHDGEDLIVRIGFGAPYAIHPAYVVVPRKGRFRRGTYIIASYSGELRHAVVKNRVRDRIKVRYTDLGVKRPDQRLDPDRVGVLPVGLAPGGYAAHLAEHEYRHVLLVSASTVAGKRKWLVLNYTGETALVPEEQLEPLPVPRLKPRVGASLLAAWRGTMVRTQVKSVDRPALLTVTRPRAGRSLLVGPGMVMPTD
jgi:hypothetical protein